MRLPIKRKIFIFLFITIFTVVQSIPTFAEAMLPNGNTGRFAAIEHSTIKFREMEYERPDLAEFYNIIHEINELSSSPSNGETVLELFFRLLDQYDNVVTMSTIMDIYVYSDMTNTYYAQEQAYMNSILSPCSLKILEAAQTIARSPCADTAKDVWGQAFFDSIAYSNDSPQEIIALDEKEKALINEYYKKLNEEYTVDYNGKELTEDEVLTLWKSDQGKELSINDVVTLLSKIRKAEGDALGSIYLELVSVRNSIAKAYGYENYYDYAYQAYGRSYHSTEMDELYKSVKNEITPLYKKLRQIRSSYKEGELEALVQDTNKNLDLISEKADGIAPEIKEAIEYMKTYDMYNADNNEHRFQISFTTTLPSFHAPYLFFTPEDSFRNFTSMIHELGHYTNEFWSEPIYAWLQKNNIDVYEIHSNGLVLLYIHYFDELFGEYADTAKIFTLSNMAESIISGCLLDELEQYVYSTESLTISDVNKKANKLAEEYGLIKQNKETGEYDGTYHWYLVSHLFLSPMYYISYSLSAIASAQIWEKSLTDRDAAIGNYLQTIELSHLPYRNVLVVCDLSQPFDHEVLKNVRAASERESKILIDTYGHWSEYYVDILVSENIINGYEGHDGYFYFRPSQSVTRAEYLKMLFESTSGQKGINYRSSISTFQDVSPEAWYAEAIQWGLNNNIVSGVSSTSFKPDATISRQDMAVMSLRFAEAFELELKSLSEKSGNPSSKPFTDEDSIANYAKDAVNKLHLSGILNGNPDGSFSPWNNLTRAEAAKALALIL